jgi:hypothetical protein
MSSSRRRVVVVEPMGAETELLVKLQDQALTVMTHGRSSARHAHLFDAATGQRL